VAKARTVPALMDKARLPGRFQVVTSKGTVPVIKSWPRPRGGNVAPAVRANVQRFCDQVALIKMAPPELLNEAIALTKNTGWYPRDLLMKAMNGGLVIAYLKDGRVLYGRQDVAQNIQALLDGIDNTIGAILVRTSGGWVGLDPDSAGKLLQSNGPGEPPSWQWSVNAGVSVFESLVPGTGNAADTSLQTLLDITIPGGLLAADADALDVTVCWSFANNFDSKTAFLKFGGVALGDIGGLASATANQIMVSHHTITRYDSGHAVEFGTHLYGNQNLQTGNSFVTANMITADLTLDQHLLFQAQTSVATANDIILQAVIVKLLRK